ncbi:MAG: OmpA family protein, partial [Cytophagales bacterium]
ENIIPNNYVIPLISEENPTEIKTNDKISVDEPRLTELKIILKVLENESKTPLSVIADLNHSRIHQKQSTDDKGLATFTLPITSNSFRLYIEKEGYMTFNEEFIFQDSEKNKNLIEKTILLNKIEIGKAIVIPNILFKQGEAVLLPSSYPELDKIVKMMEDNPKMEIELSGHTDNQGEPKLNQILSEDRVESVKKYLVQKGIKEKRITGKGYGQTKPIADNKKEATRKLNRRVEFTVTKF